MRRRAEGTLRPPRARDLAFEPARRLVGGDRPHAFVERQPELQRRVRIGGKGGAAKRGEKKSSEDFHQ